MKFRRLSPFTFLGLLPLDCFTQGLPGTDGGGGGAGGGGGGAPPAQGGTPAAGGTAAGQPANGGAGGTTPAPNPGQFEPGWLNERIGQAKTSARTDLLKELGVPDVDAAKKLLEDGKKAVDANKTELQRKDDRIRELEPVKAQADTYREALGKRASAELGRLPQQAQDKIKAMFGDNPDPIKVLEAIDLANAMATGTQGSAGGQHGQGQPAGGAPQQGATPPNGVQGTPPAAPPANTTASAGGPPSATGSPPDHYAIWMEMREKNPMAAAQYLIANQAAIVAASQAKNK